MMKSWLAIAVIVAVVVISFFVLCNTIAGLRNDLRKVRAIAEDLPDDVVTMSVMDNHILKEISRIDGTDSLIIETNYVPFESEVVTTVVLNEEALTQLEQTQLLLWELRQNVQNSADSARIDSLNIAIRDLRRNLYITDVDYDTHGFCFVPEVGVGVDTDLNPNIEAGARLYYINRFGIGLQGALEIPSDSTESWSGAVGLFGDWRIPGLDNAALSGSPLLYDFSDEKIKGMIGIHVYLN